MNKSKEIFKKYRVLIYTILGVLSLFFLWWLISFIIKTTLFPGPEVVIPNFFFLLSLKETYLDILGTILRLLISLLLSLFAGIVFGVLGGVFERFRIFFRPFITVLKTIPTAAVIFILIVLLKPLWATIIVTFLITFPLIYENVVVGFTSVDKDIINSMKVDGTRLSRAIFRVYFPLSKNYILLGITQIIGLGMKVSIMAEVLAGSDSLSGIGREIYYSSIIGDVTNIMSYSLIAIFIIGLTDIALHYAKKNLKKDNN